MKKYVMTFVACMLALAFCKAQELYSKTYDSPEDVIKGHVAIEYYGVDVGFENITGVMIFAVGINGSYRVTPQIDAEASLKVPLFRFEKQGAAFILDGGINYTLSSSTADTDVRVLLGYKEEDIGNNLEVHTTKYTIIHGSVQKKILVRGGVYLKNTAIEYKGGNFEDYKPTNLFHKGIYIGIGKQRQYFFQLKRNIGSRETHFAAGSIFRPYLDVLVLPTKVELERETYGMGGGPSKDLTGLIGARAGFKWYRNPFTREQNHEHRISFFGNSIVSLEAGVRPLEGLFISGGVSYIFKKF